MKRRASPTRIGLFILGAIAVLVAAVVMISRGGLLADRQRALAYFEGSVYGLQLGAPVVLRGVRLGSVVGVGVVYEGQPGRYAVPVEIEIDRGLIGSVTGGAAPATVEALVEQGMTAQLSMQSLLTGLLYVDLDLGRGAPGSVSGAASAPAPKSVAPRAGAAPLPVIPTRPTPLQALQRKLQDVDVDALLADITGAAAGARALVTNPRLQQTIDELAQAGADLRQLLARLDRRVDPLADAVQGTLQASHKAATSVSTGLAHAADAVDRVSRAADRVTATMERFDRLADNATPLLESARETADELTRTAQALRQATIDDDGTLPRIDEAAHELSRAARAVRELADLLERQPEALLRGRVAGP